MWHNLYTEQAQCRIVYHTHESGIIDHKHCGAYPVEYGAVGAFTFVSLAAHIMEYFRNLVELVIYDGAITVKAERGIMITDSPEHKLHRLPLSACISYGNGSKYYSGDCCCHGEIHFVQTKKQTGAKCTRNRCRDIY